MVLKALKYAILKEYTTTNMIMYILAYETYTNDCFEEKLKLANIGEIFNGTISYLIPNDNICELFRDYYETLKEYANYANSMPMCIEIAFINILDKYKKEYDPLKYVSKPCSYEYGRKRGLYIDDDIIANREKQHAFWYIDKNIIIYDKQDSPIYKISGSYGTFEETGIAYFENFFFKDDIDIEIYKDLIGATNLPIFSIEKLMDGKYVKLDNTYEYLYDLMVYLVDDLKK